MALVVSELIRQAFEDLGVATLGETLSPEWQDLALRRLNRILATFSQKPELAVADIRQDVPVPANTSPFAIGPTGQYVIAVRPALLWHAAVLLPGTSPPIAAPIRVRSRDWFMTLRARTLSGPLPTDAFYDPSWPNASLHLWPVPTQALTLQLTFPRVVGPVALADTIDLPGPHEEYLVARLAITLASSLGVAAPPGVREAYMQATQRMRERADRVPAITLDVPGQVGSAFDYQVGE